MSLFQELIKKKIIVNSGNGNYALNRELPNTMEKFDEPFEIQNNVVQPNTVANFILNSQPNFDMSSLSLPDNQIRSVQTLAKLKKEEKEKKNEKNTQTLDLSPENMTNLPLANQDVNLTNIESRKGEVKQQEQQANQKQESPTWFKSPQQGNVVGNSAATIADFILSGGEGFMESVIESPADLLLNVAGTIEDIRRKTNPNGGLKRYTDVAIPDVTGQDYRDLASNTSIWELMGAKELQNKIDPYSYLGEKSKQIGQTVGFTAGMAVSTPLYGDAVGISGGNIPIKIGNKGLNIPMMSVVSGAANSLNETNKENPNATNTQRWLKGGAAGAIEGFSEGLFGLFGVGGSSIEENIEKSILDRISSGAGKLAARYGLNMTEEATEELISYAGNYLADIGIDKITGSDTAKEWNWEELGMQMLMAFISTGISTAPSTGIQIMNTNSLSNDVVKTIEENTGSTLSQEDKKEIKKQVSSIFNGTSENKEELIQNLKQNAISNQNDEQNAILRDVNNQTQQVIQNTQQNAQNATSKQIEQNEQNSKNDALEQEKNNLIKEIEKEFTGEDRQNLLSYINNKDITQEDINSFKEGIKFTRDTMLNTDETYDTGRKRTYVKYMNKVSSYDKSALTEAKETVPANNQGRRTKEQWLQVAEQIGTNIADKSTAEIEEIAYRTWQDEKPNSKENLNRQGKKYVEFTSDEWINKIYDTVKSIDNQDTQTQQVSLNDEVKQFLENSGRTATNEDVANFIERASNFTLEEGDNSNPELRSLIEKIQQNNISEQRDETEVDLDKGTFKAYNGKTESIPDNIIPYITAEPQKASYLRYSQEESFFNLSLEEMEKATAGVSEQATRTFKKGETKGMYNDDQYVYKYKLLGNEGDFGITSVKKLKKGLENKVNGRQGNRINRHAMESEEYRNQRDSRNSELIGNGKTNTTTNRLAERTRPRNIEDNTNNRQIRRNSGKIENSNQSSFSLSDEELQEQENSQEQSDTQRLINSSMTMEQAKDMVQRTFIANNIRDWYDGKYKNGDEWLQGEGVDEVEEYADNTELVVDKFLNPLYAKDANYGYDYTTADILNAYLEGTLTGSETEKAKRLDVSKDTDYQSSNFYEPRKATEGIELYNKANERVTNSNRQEIYKARADFIINAQQTGYIESLGLAPKEVANKLRNWANYTTRAINLSNSMNEGTSIQNRWSGIENSSIVNSLTVTDEQLEKMVKEIKGNSSEYERRYITSTMLAIDCHTDFSNLTFEFIGTRTLPGKTALGDYNPNNDVIRIGETGQNTVAHEIGHYLDHLWGRQLLGSNLGITNRTTGTIAKNLTENQQQFLDNFYSWFDDVERSADIGSKYKMTPTEVMARFVARFTEWTKNVATNNRYGYETRWYDDNFTESQFREFAKLLQEKSLLDTTENYANYTKTEWGGGKIAEDRLDDFFNYNEESTKSDLEVLQEETNKLRNNETIEEQAEKFVDQMENQIDRHTEEAARTDNKMVQDILKTTDTESNENNQKGLKQEFKNTSQRLRELVTNRNAVIDDFSKEVGNAEIKYKADRLNNTAAQADYDITVAQTNNDGIKIGEGLNSLFDWAKKADCENEFNDYLIQKANIERATNNKGLADISAKDSQEAVKEYEKKYPEFKQRAEAVNQYSRNILKSGVESGRYTQELYDYLTKDLYQNYVPYIVEDDSTKIPINEDVISKGTVKTAKGGADIDSLMSVYESLKKQTVIAKNAVAQNELYKEIVDTIKAKKGEVTDAKDLQYLNANTENLLQDSRGHKYLTAFENGEAVTVKISDELAESLLRRAEMLQKETEEKLNLLLAAPRTLGAAYGKIHTTYNLVFPIKNFLKDIQDALFTTKHFKDFSKRYLSSFHDIITNTDTAQQFEALYGANAAEQEAGNKVKLGKKAKGVLHKLRRVNEIIELAPRYAEFMASRDNGATVNEALYNAREITTNFGRGGRITKALNRNGATFLNASVQGMSKFVRNFSEAVSVGNVKGATGLIANQLLKVTARAVSLGVIPAILNHLVYDDDDDYKALPDYIKDNYYLFKIDNDGDKFFLRIPKGRMLSVFGSAARRTLELVQGEQDAFEGFLSNAWEQTGANNPLTDNFLAPIFQAASNKTWYDTDLVPTRLQNQLPENQYDESIDKCSIWLGQTLKMSPYKINYILQQYGGSITDIIFPMITDETNTANEDNLGGVLLAPIQDQFAVNSTFDNKYAGEFYDLKDEVEKISNDPNASEDQKVQFKYLSDISSQMAELYKTKREIQGSDLTNKEKYDQVAVVQQQINQLAFNAINKYQSADIYNNYADIDGEEYYKNNEGKWSGLTESLSSKVNSLGLTGKGKDNYIKAYQTQNEIDNNDNLSNSQKKTQIINALVNNSTLSDSEKASIYLSKYKTDETYEAISNSNINFNNYAKASLEVSNIKSQYKDTDTRKQKITDYLNTLNLNSTQKNIMYKLVGGYSIKGHESQVSSYIEGLPMTATEKQALYDKLFK